MKNKTKTLAILALITLVISLSGISAFSVSAPYMGVNKTMTLLPDAEPTDLEFVLQNGGATENILVRVLVLEGSEIANITGESNIYSIIPGEKVPVNLRVTLPEGAAIGDSYDISLEFSTVSSGQAGEFGFGTGQEQNFKVVVVREALQEGSGASVPLIIGIVIVLAIIIAILAKKRNTSQVRK